MRPVDAFRIGDRFVITCEVEDGNPISYQNREFYFYNHEKRIGRIRIIGVSTATLEAESCFDFLYTGDEIFPEQLNDECLLIALENIQDW